MSSYLAVDRRAVLAFFNPFKTEQFLKNYFATIMLLRAQDQHSIKCLRSIYFILSFQFILLVYLYLCPFQWQHTMLFDIFDQSNNYPNMLKLNASAVVLMGAYIFHMLYVHISEELCFKLLYDYFINNSRTFVSTPSSKIMKLVLVILNAYQVVIIVVVPYLLFEYIGFTHRIFRNGLLFHWTQWIEFVSMNFFFLIFTSAFCLLISMSFKCILCTAMCTSFLVFRFHKTHRLLSSPYCRFTTLRLLRFVQQNTGTMQYIFSVNRLYGPILLAFISANLPSNIMIGTYLLQNRFSAKQMFFMLMIFLGQLSCFFGVHLVAAAFSKRIHSPYKRMMSLNILIHRCPLRARIHLVNAIQAFHVRKKKYGVTYGTGKWTFGLITMMSFTKFILLYGKQLMYQYNHLEPSS